MSDEQFPPFPVLASSPCLQGERVVFTGTLASMPHRQAHELVNANGGEASAHLSRQTTMLVVGEEGWPLDERGRASVKLQQAVDLVNAGVPLQILKESDWLRLLGLEHRRRDIHRLFTPAMLQQKLGIPVGVVRRWERLGLITAEQRVYRLPYFDFQEVAAVRHLQNMLQAGITREQIESSLQGLRSLLPGVDRPLAQLEILGQDSRVLYRDRAGLVEASSGQRVFEFTDERSHVEGAAGHGNGDDGASRGTIAAGDVFGHASEAGPSLDTLTDQNGTRQRQDADVTGIDSDSGDPGSQAAASGGSESDRDGSDERSILAFPTDLTQEPDRSVWTAEDWFDHGFRLLERDQVGEAVEAFRLAAMGTPDDPEVHFILATALFRMDNVRGALERYHMAVELDHDYIEAWTQLGCVRHLLGELDNALDAFNIALTAHPDYADAMYHKADVLDELSRTAEAIELWQRYLAFDESGPWANDVRARLEAAIEPEGP